MRPREPHVGEAHEAAALDYLSIALSHPRWLVERWLRRMPFEDVESWLRFNNSPAPLTLRINSLRTTRDQLTALLAARGIKVVPTEWAPDGLVVTDGNPLTADLPPGLFIVQDEASQIVPLLVAARAGARILDACAAPGGKTIALANAARGHATIVANDFRPRRVALLRSTLANAGVRGAVVVRADVERRLPFAPAFDAVLLDAPCSGLGTLRRDPEIRWRRQPDDLVRLATAQYRMLCHAAAVVRPGGEVVYSTCSSEPEENEAVVTMFLERNPAFALVSRDDAGRRVPQRAQSLIDEKGYLLTSPPRHGLEAFFGAILTHRP